MQPYLRKETCTPGVVVIMVNWAMVSRCHIFGKIEIKVLPKGELWVSRRYSMAGNVSYINVMKNQDVDSIG